MNVGFFANAQAMMEVSEANLKMIDNTGAKNTEQVCRTITMDLRNRFKEQKQQSVLVSLILKLDLRTCIVNWFALTVH